MISWKIWAIHSNVPGPVIAGVRFMGVVTVIVESGQLSWTASINGNRPLIALCKCSGCILVHSHRNHNGERPRNNWSVDIF